MLYYIFLVLLQKRQYMILEFKRCRHCGSEYEYQASGYACRSPNNDKDYCPECMKIILEVLNKQPVKRNFYELGAINHHCFSGGSSQSNMNNFA